MGNIKIKGDHESWESSYTNKFTLCWPKQLFDMFECNIFLYVRYFIEVFKFDNYLNLAKKTVIMED